MDYFDFGNYMPDTSTPQWVQDFTKPNAPQFSVGGPGFDSGSADTAPNASAPDFGNYSNAGGSAPFDWGSLLPKGTTSWEKLLGALGQIGGGYMMNKTGKENEAQRIAEWNQVLQANRPNQYSPFGSTEWSKDDKGNWVQTTKLTPERQKMLDAYNEIGNTRLENAKGIPLPKGGIDYGLLGLSNIAKAAGITEGQSPDARAAQPPYNPYADFAGGILSPYYQRGARSGSFNPITGQGGG